LSPASILCAGNVIRCHCARTYVLKETSRRSSIDTAISCHHSGDIAPMSLVTYQEVRPWAAAIREAVALRRMPPWLADPKVGHWSNDPRLSEREISTLEAWTERGKLEGNPRDLPQPPAFHDGWENWHTRCCDCNPEHKLAAQGPDEYAYINVPTNFTEDRWSSQRSCARAIARWCTTPTCSW